MENGQNNESNKEQNINSEEVLKDKKKNKKESKIFKIIVLTLLIILAVIILGTVCFVKGKLSKIQRIDINEEELNISSETEENLSEYRNIALFGIDSRQDTYSKGNRSDCIIIASLNNKTKEIKLISVYRDTYVEIEGYGLDKITHAYSYGGAPLAIKTLNENLDLNIKEFVTVNFDSLAEAVNQLDGIIINIESQEELNYLNSYIGETAKVTGLSNEKVKGIGRQKLNGVQAVAYSRIRYTEGGDYKRTERMRIVIEAMVDKLKTKNVGEINSFIDHILPKVYTNIKTGDIVSLIPSTTSFKITESIGWPYKTEGITLDKWYGIPITLESNVIKLHEEGFKEPNYNPSDRVKEISDKIIKMTGYK